MIGDEMNFEEMLNECNDAFAEMEFERLIELCDGILEECPDNHNAMGYKGISLCFLGRPEEALEILERAVELHPDIYYLYNNLAMVYFDLGEYEKSLKCCEDGLKIRDFDWLCENKMKALVKLDRVEEAMEFERSIDHVVDLVEVFPSGLPSDIGNK